VRHRIDQQEDLLCIRVCDEASNRVHVVGSKQSTERNSSPLAPIHPRSNAANPLRSTVRCLTRFPEVLLSPGGIPQNLEIKRKRANDFVSSLIRFRVHFQVVVAGCELAKPPAVLEVTDGVS